MRSIPTMTAATIATMIAAAPALAGSSGYMDSAGAPRDSWMSIGAIADQFTQMGYTVRGVEVDDGRYEIKAIDPNGMRVEAYVDPVSGEVLRRSRDD